jgi:MerR family transcriptional regulator, copper efflux regulator
MAQIITIGHVAKVTGVAAKTIRYYEEIGVLPAPTRTASGYRQYDEPGVRRVRFIRRARTLGLPLRSLGTLTATLNGGSRPALRPRLLALVRAQLSAVRDRMAELQLLQQELEQILRRPLAPARERLTKGCQCLEVEGTRRRSQQRMAP